MHDPCADTDAGLAVVKDTSEHRVLGGLVRIGSPLEELIGKQEVAAYDDALAALEPPEREAIVGRVELGLSYAELAAAMGRPSADAARMAVGRALPKLARQLKLP